MLDGVSKSVALCQVVYSGSCYLYQILRNKDLLGMSDKTEDVKLYAKRKPKIHTKSYMHLRLIPELFLTF